MNVKLIKIELKKAKSYLHKIDESCGLIANELQKYFNQDICVFEQSGDGFVILYEDEDNDDVPENIPVEYAIENIKKDPEYYK